MVPAEYEFWTPPWKRGQPALQAHLARAHINLDIATDVMVAVGARRLLLIAASIFIVLTFGFLARSDRITTWPTANAPAAVSEDYFSLHDYGAPKDDAEQEPVASKPVFPVATSEGAAAPTSIIGPQKGHPTPLTLEEYPEIQAPVDPSTQSTNGPDSMSRWDPSAYTVVSSRMTLDKKWFPIDFGYYGSYNPNLIPHPWKNETWVMIAQGKQEAGGVKGALHSIELVCDAAYVNGKMSCVKPPISLPIASTVSDHCTGELDWFNWFIGPTDPRVFFGPDRPYITYGSGSQYTCLGQWIHDLRRLVQWEGTGALNRANRFFWPTELQRPPPYQGIEKNWFAFWDNEGEMYLHYNIHPARSFAKVGHDGRNISDDLAPVSREKDDICIKKYMPSTLGSGEHIHQATNSLAITMCARADTTCDVAHNTFVFTIFHYKTYHGHNIYEPYIMMFEQKAPFDIHAISSKPFWINGRQKPGQGDGTRPADQSQMMYITSMSWKDTNLTYHGYMDDELMIAFGIEDNAAGGIDVVAGDLLQEMRHC